MVWQLIKILRNPVILFDVMISLLLSLHGQQFIDTSFLLLLLLLNSQNLLIYSENIFHFKKLRHVKKDFNGVSQQDCNSIDAFAFYISQHILNNFKKLIRQCTSYPGEGDDGVSFIVKMQHQHDLCKSILIFRTAAKV